MRQSGPGAHSPKKPEARANLGRPTGEPISCQLAPGPSDNFIARAGPAAYYLIAALSITPAGPLAGPSWRWSGVFARAHLWCAREHRKRA